MAQTIVYVGSSQVRRITEDDWDSLGITEPTHQWDKSNSYEQVLGDTAAAWALAQSDDFITEEGLTFPDVVDNFAEAVNKEVTVHGRQHTSPMRGWLNGVARVVGGGFFSNAYIALVGDSISQLGSFSDVATQLNRALNGNYASPPYFKNVRGTFGWDYSGGGTVMGSAVDGRGVNNNLNQMAVNDECIINALDFSSLQFKWEAGAVGCQFEIYIDAVLVSTQSATTRGGYLYDATTRATRHVRVKCIGNTGYLNGVTVFPRANSYLGNHVVMSEYSKSGTGTQTFVDNPDIIPNLVIDNPDLVIVATGINDGAHVDPVEYKTRMKGFIQSIKAALPLASVALWIPPETGGHQPWAAVATKAHEICREENVAPIDLYEVMGYIGGADPYDFSNDGVHFSAKGKQVNGQTVLKVLFGDATVFPGAGLFGAVRQTGVTVGDENLAAKQSLFMHRSIVGLEYAAVMDPTQASFRPMAVASDPANGSYSANRAYVDKRKFVTKAASWGVVAGGSEAGVTYKYTAAGAAVFTLPTNAASPMEVGTRLEVKRDTGAGAVTWAANGNTVNARGGLTTVAEGGTAVFTKEAASVWSVTGDLV